MTDAFRHFLADGLMIAWKRECARSAAVARTLRIPLHLIQPSDAPGVAGKITSYIRSAIATFSLLLTARPKTVLCLNQPPFLPLTCTAYAMLFGAKVVMDFHSGALTKKAWRPFRGAYRWLVRRAPFTICHNWQDAEVVADWGGRVAYLPAMPPINEPGFADGPAGCRPTFMFSCSFADDEPIEMTLAAMRASPAYDFVVSGDYSKRGIDPHQTPNIRFAGFMSYAEYRETMRQSWVVLTLSTRQHIMQMAVEEALALGVPVVTNDSPVLREVLGSGGVFVNLDAASIGDGFAYAATHHDALLNGMVDARARLVQRVDGELERLAVEHPKLFAVGVVG